jgi:hypothetical protein
MENIHPNIQQTAPRLDKNDITIIPTPVLTPSPTNKSTTNIQQLKDYHELQQSNLTTIRYIQRAYKTAKTPTLPIRVNIDGGANRSITNDITILSNFKNIKSYSIDGVAGHALNCTGKGILPWRADSGEILFVQCYYSDNATETIISPTDVVINKTDDLYAWGQYSNINTQKGCIKFYR